MADHFVLTFTSGTVRDFTGDLVTVASPCVVLQDPKTGSRLYAPWDHIESLEQYHDDDAG